MRYQMARKKKEYYALASGDSTLGSEQVSAENVNRGTQLCRIDEWGVPIPYYVEDNDPDPRSAMLFGPNSIIISEDGGTEVE